VGIPKEEYYQVTIWQRTAEPDLCPLNFGLARARWRAMDRPAWHLLVDVATSSWHAPERERVLLQFLQARCLSCHPSSQPIAWKLCNIYT